MVGRGGDLFGRSIAAALVFAGVLAPATLAQDPPLLREGLVVRVVTQRPGATASTVLARGTVRRLAGDTVALISGGLTQPTVQTVVVTDSRRVDVLVARRTRGREGAAIGMVVGALVGAVVGAATWDPCTHTPTSWVDMTCMFHPSQGEQAAGGALLGFLGGAVVGLIVGTTIRIDRWAPVRAARTSGGW